MTYYNSFLYEKTYEFIQSPSIEKMKEIFDICAVENNCLEVIDTLRRCLLTCLKLPKEKSKPFIYLPEWNKYSDRFTKQFKLCREIIDENREKMKNEL